MKSELNQTSNDENLNQNEVQIIPPVLDNTRWKKQTILAFKVLIVSALLFVFFCATSTIGIGFGIVYLIFCITLLLASVFFLVWFYREYCNLHRVIPYAQYKKSWAIWSWFVPLICLYRPYTIMKELHVYSEGGDNQEEKVDTSMLVAWWTLWIIGGFLNIYVDKMSEEFASPEEALPFWGLVLLFMAIDAILLVIIIKKIDVTNNVKRE